MATTAKPQLLRRTDENLRGILEDTSRDHEELGKWFVKLDEWQERVRRDIIELEKCVKSHHSEFKPGKPPNGGDPGDPPRGPW